MRTEPLWQRPEVMRPMDAQPGLLSLAPLPMTEFRMEPDRVVSVAAAHPVLAPDEAEVAALALRMALEDFENLDPACVLNVWEPSPVVRSVRLLNHDATRARVEAARRALVKMEGMQAEAIADGVTDRYSGALRELAE
jgi:hypothetical protein